MKIEITILDTSSVKIWNDILNSDELQEERKECSEYGLRIIATHKIGWQEMESDCL
jgi:hypothetical protein